MELVLEWPRNCSWLEGRHMRFVGELPRVADCSNVGRVQDFGEDMKFEAREHMGCSSRLSAA